MTNVCGCTVLEAIPTVMYNSSELLEAMVISDSSYGCLISWNWRTRGCQLHPGYYSFQFDPSVGQMFIHAQCSQLQSVK